MATKTGKKSRAELSKELDELAERQRVIEEELAASRDEELQSLVDTFKKHLDDNEFDLSEALKLLGVKKTRAKRGSVVKAPKDYVVGVTYKNPKGDETWIGGSKGKKPKWLTDLLDAGRKFESLAVKR
jgi:DNA-binding protein H-NS